MANQQEAIYQGYVERVTANNVEPIVSEQGVWPEKLDGEEWTREEGRGCLTHRWGDREYGPVQVYSSNKGRVMEVQSLRRGASFQAAVHRTRDDYWNYRRPLGMFHYLYT